MTNEPEPHPSRSSGSGEEILRLRLDQARAELTGHGPAPDQRLEAMFLTGHAPVDATDALTLTAEPEPLGTSASASPWRRLTVAAIAASFVLLVGLAAFAAGRGDPDAPVEVAGDTVAGSGENLAVDAGSGATGNEADGGEWESLGPALAEQLKSLWSENRGWVDCVTQAIDTWAQSTGTGTSDLRRGFELVAECGAPSLGDFDPADLAIPGLDLDELQLPGLVIPGPDGGDLCEKVETDTGTTITCHLPDGSWFESFGGLGDLDWPRFLEELQRWNDDAGA
jgi:hypothetical protein